MREKVQINQAWQDTFTTVRDNYPYCIFYKVKIENGMVKSWESALKTVGFGKMRRRYDSCSRETIPDSNWQELVEFCQKERNCTLHEIHFYDAQPILLKYQEYAEDIKKEVLPI